MLFSGNLGNFAVAILLSLPVKVSSASAMNLSFSSLR